MVDEARLGVRESRGCLWGIYCGIEALHVPEQVKSWVGVSRNWYYMRLLHILIGLAEVNVDQDTVTPGVNLDVASSQDASWVKIRVLRDDIRLTEQAIK